MARSFFQKRSKNIIRERDTLFYTPYEGKIISQKAGPEFLALTIVTNMLRNNLTVDYVELRVVRAERDGRQFLIGHRAVSVQEIN